MSAVDCRHEIPQDRLCSTTMTKTLRRAGRHTILPVVGDTLVELTIGVSKLPLFVFRAEDGGESELRIEDCLLVMRDDHEILKVESKRNARFDPQGLSPLLCLLGCEVTEAIAEESGRLRVDFSNGFQLRVTPTTGFEAWHFQFPRPGRPVGGPLDQLIAITGAHGHLI